MARADPILVDPEVSRSKLKRELEQWEAARAEYDRRGYFLKRVEDLQLEVGFSARLVPGLINVPVVPICARVDFSNYDIWAPSVTFVDFWSGEPQAALPVLIQQSVNGQPRNLFLLDHPITGLPFLCLPGVREYHQHPHHSGDDWLVRRGRGEGNLAYICDAIWKYASRNVIGLSILFAQHPQAGTVLQFSLAQSDLDAPVIPAAPVTS